MFTLPRPGTVEHVELDFKQEVGKLANGKVNSLELAKDIAAMANALGGHIVIGATENPKHTLFGYKPTEQADAAAVCALYTRAMQDYLRPAPVAVGEAIAFEGGGFIPVIRVEASQGQAIGLRFPVDRDQELKPREVYGFPVRVGDNTSWYTPEQLPMLMLPEQRRIIALLHQIGKEALQQDRILKGGLEAGGDNFWIVEIQVDRNFVRLTRQQGSGDVRSDHFIPLDSINSIYWDNRGWRIRHTPGY
jgi:Putative DNA-binding domain